MELGGFSILKYGTVFQMTALNTKEEKEDRLYYTTIYSTQNILTAYSTKEFNIKYEKENHQSTPC